LRFRRNGPIVTGPCLTSASSALRHRGTAVL